MKKTGITTIIATVTILNLQGQERTRAEEILAERVQKEQNLRPEEQSSLERKLDWVKETGLERFAEGWHGFRAKVGGLAPGGGFAVGPEYNRSGLWNGRLDFRAGYQASARGYHKQDMHVGLPRLMNRRVRVDLYAVRHDYPSLNYYGSGPDSARSGRSAYRLEDTAIDAAVTVDLTSRWRAGGGAGYLFNNVGRGTDSRFVSSEEVYSVPGFDAQSNFARVGAFVQYDSRDFAPGPRSGGNYVAQVHRFSDRTFGRFDFHRLDLEAQQYVPLFNKRRVIALRAKSITSFARDGETLPFYMQPVLGGSDDLRGYRPFRFRGNNLLVINAEYRWEVFSGMDMALFTDAGKVYQQRSEFNLRNLESNVGFGLRFNARNMTFMRIDVGFSHEGYQVSVKFNDIFRRGPVHTSSTQGDF
jgi:outer membrane protein assembly factor BamA